MLNDRAVDVLGEDGPFAATLSKFTVRSSQTELADAIEQAISNGTTLLAESGTGTGKTFAYLVPALLSVATEDKKTLISTGTKHLQEQLFHRDIPVVLDKLKTSATVSLLKGRANYLCIDRFHQAKNASRRLDNRQLAELESIGSWHSLTASGDIAELVDVPEDSQIWQHVTSTVDNCLGKGCQFFEDCHVNKARKKALVSDIVVINHHLYFADKSLKEDGFGALLPSVDTVIFDEAHQIPDIASNFLGKNFSSWQIMELVNDVRLAEMTEKSLMPKLIPLADELSKMMADYRLSLGIAERRIAWLELIDELPSLPKKLANLVNKLNDFSDVLEHAAVKGEALTRCFERSVELAKLVQEIITDKASANSKIKWVEIANRTFRINETPLNVGDELSAFFANKEQARIFTSATLSVDGNFGHFQKLMGLPKGESEYVEVKSWPSPFDYFNQGVLYVPEGLPEPRDEAFSDAMFNASLPLIQASGGKTFVLFTSFKIMRLFAEKLEAHDFEVFMQGDSNKTDLLKNFSKQDNSVLLGTMSFWEGVDVPGDKLTTVIIDKLPFESPFEPVLKARLAAMQEAGENPFMNYQVPRAVITLRQGSGRLIRSQSDKGVLMICDSRLRGTHYGKIFLNSLPPMRRTSNEEKVCGFLKSLNK